MESSVTHLMSFVNFIVYSILYARRYPPTTRSHYSDVTDQEIDHYPYTNEGSPFIPPPPTPHQTSDAEDDA